LSNDKLWLDSAHAENCDSRYLASFVKILNIEKILIYTENIDIYNKSVIDCVKNVLVVITMVVSTVEMEKVEEKTEEVLMITAPKNFRDEELFKPKVILEKNGYNVTIASLSRDMAKGMLGAKVVPDITLDEVDVDRYNAVIFVGGSGAEVYFDDEVAHSIAKDAYEKNKVLGAICIAPSTLAKAGVLKNKRATVWSSVLVRKCVNILKANGAIYVNEDVVVDGRIVTANGPGAAEKFGNEIVKLLKT